MKVIDRETLISLLLNQYADREYLMAMDLDRILHIHGVEARVQDDGKMNIRK